MADHTLTTHVRSVQSLGTEVAAEGRHEDAWQIFKDSATSVIAASPTSPNNKMLKLAVRLAEQENDMSVRTNIMQQAFDEVLGEKVSRHNAARTLESLDQSHTARGQQGMPMTPVRRRPGTGPVGVTPERPSLAMGLSRPSVPDGLSRHYASWKPGSASQGAFRPRPPHGELPDLTRQSEELINLTSNSDLYRDTGEDLHQLLRESDLRSGKLPTALPPAGKRPLSRVSSAPYFACRPNESFTEERPLTQQGTSHYTNLGGPRTNQNFPNSLPGGNYEFDDRYPWKTSSQVFQRDAELYDLDPGNRFARDRNFQYVNGEKRQGVASIRQRVRMPAHHCTPNCRQCRLAPEMNTMYCTRGL